ncbi:DUF3786 domain-containing protein [Haloimpatiens lingqiaonensis]|uniref:DUF3786 domain-containing protein n=1 Tax=Haloimpatiens lingqiaonensis TaxID=1380675 RepID=UPI0010FD6955|nr:DUF3786 domain-containing protein [Haloimpatiens lingqiaonensis]
MTASKDIDNRQGRVPYEYIQNIFKNHNPKEMEKLTGVTYEEERKTFKIRLMGKNYYVEYPSADTFNEDGQEIKGYTIKTIFLRYLVNGKGIPPTGKDITYKEIPGGHTYYPNFSSRTIARLAKLFGDNLEFFQRIFEKMGAERVKSGHMAYRFEFMNNVYMTFIVWQGDDEFSSSANILFDYNTIYYFNAEDLAVVGEVAIEIVRNGGELPKGMTLYTYADK